MCSVDLGYFAYLASNIPPRELARAVAVRARRALRGGIRQVLGPVARHPALRPPFFMQVPAQQHKARELRGKRPSIIDPELREITVRVLRERFPEACRYVLREAEASRRGEVAVFGKWKDCRKRGLQPAGAGPDAVAIDYNLDPIGHEIRYDPAVPGTRVNLFQAGADAKAAWEVGRLQQLWRYGQARWLAGTATERSAWARAFMATIRQFRADCPPGMGVQWSCAMEVSSRAFHAALAFAYVQDDPAIDARFTGELCEMLDEHCRYVEEHLEETGAVRTNHYAADLVGLVVVGSLFPELPRARIWRDGFGRRLSGGGGVAFVRVWGGAVRDAPPARRRPQPAPGRRPRRGASPRERLPVPHRWTQRTGRLRRARAQRQELGGAVLRRRRPGAGPRHLRVRARSGRARPPPGNRRSQHRAGGRRRAEPDHPRPAVRAPRHFARAHPLDGSAQRPGDGQRRARGLPAASAGSRAQAAGRAGRRLRRLPGRCVRGGGARAGGAMDRA